jgi:hypothetical protein
MVVSSKKQSQPVLREVREPERSRAVTYWKIRRETRPSVIHRAIAQASPLTTEEGIMTLGGEDS